MNDMNSYLSKKQGKMLNVVMVGSGGAQTGTLIVSDDNFLTMDTRWSSKHLFRISQIASIWCDEDKPNEE